MELLHLPKPLYSVKFYFFLSILWIPFRAGYIWYDYLIRWCWKERQLSFFIGSRGDINPACVWERGGEVIMVLESKLLNLLELLWSLSVWADSSLTWLNTAVISQRNYYV